MLEHIGRDVFIDDTSLDADQCKALITMFHEDCARRKLQDEASGDYSGNTNYTNSVVPKERYPKMYGHFVELVDSYVKKIQLHTGITSSFGNSYEPFEMLCFEQRKGSFDAHFDSHGSAHNRNLAFIWYLNDVELGGELHLPSDEQYIKVKPKSGRLVVVPADWMHYHYVTKPETSSRYSMMTFLCYS